MLDANARRDQAKIARSIRHAAWHDPHLNPLPSLGCRCCSYGLPDEKKLFEMLWRAAADDATTAVPVPVSRQCSRENPCGATIDFECGKPLRCAYLPLASAIAPARSDTMCSAMQPCLQKITVVCTPDVPCGLTTTMLNIDHRRPGFAALRQVGDHLLYRRADTVDESVYSDAVRAMMTKFELPEVRESRVPLLLFPPRDEVSSAKLVFAIIGTVSTAVHLVAFTPNPLLCIAMVASVVVVLVTVLIPGEIDRRWNRYICGR